MKRRWHWLLPAALLLAALVVGEQTRAAGGYALVRGVADQSSVLVAQGGAYQLQGSVGQPFAGSASAGTTWLGAEYWYGGGGSITTPAGRRLYLPLTRR
jgi:hypothetical protein